MKVKNLDLSKSLGSRVKIVKAKDKPLENKTGELTMPFGNWQVGDIGIFLDEPLDFCKDIYNLSREDEVEVIEEDLQIGNA